MSKNLQIFIPEPCGEDWENMGEAGMGRFCSSCCKTVVDFSLMSDQEVLSYLGSQERKVCGRFTPDQLNRDIRLGQATPKKSWSVIWRLAMVGMLLSVKSQAQQKFPKTGTGKVVKKKLEKEPQIMGIMIVLPEPKMHTVSVVDSVTHLPVSFATIRIGPGQKGFSADAAGICIFPVPAAGEPGTIEISSVGYAARVIPLDETMRRQTQWTITLSPKITSLGEVVIRSYDTHKLSGVMGVVVTVTKKDLFVANTVMQGLSDTLAFLGIRPKAVSVYPNPAPRGSVIRLSFPPDQGGTFHLGLFNTAGAMMLEKNLELTGKSQTELLTIPSILAAGIYFLKMDSPGPGKKFTQKLVVL